MLLAPLGLLSQYPKISLSPHLDFIHFELKKITSDGLEAAFLN